MGFKSPYEVLHKRKPDYSYLRVFGSTCYPCLRPYANKKFDPRSLQCIFLGYHVQYKGYRCLHPPTGRIYISRHVIFDEDLFPFEHWYKDFVEPMSTPLLKAWQSTPSPPSLFPTVQHPTPMLHQTLAVVRDIDVATPAVEPDRSEIHAFDEVLDQATLPSTPPVQTEQPRSHQMTTRLQRGITKPNPRYTLIMRTDLPTVPRTTAAALKHEGWRNSMGEEIYRSTYRER